MMAKNRNDSQKNAVTLGTHESEVLSAPIVRDVCIHASAHIGWLRV
jgi:hypothetical protein